LTFEEFNKRFPDGTQFAKATVGGVTAFYHQKDGQTGRLLSDGNGNHRGEILTPSQEFLARRFFEGIGQERGR
jgi:hypothetical protein